MTTTSPDCAHKHLEIDTDRDYYACRDCWTIFKRKDALAILAGRPRLQVVPDLPEVPPGTLKRFSTEDLEREVRRRQGYFDEPT